MTVLSLNWDYFIKNHFEHLNANSIFYSLYVYHIVYDKQCQNTLLRFYCIARRSLMWWKLCLLIHQNNAYLFGLFPTPLQFNPFLHFINEFIKAPEDLGGYRYLVPSKVALRYTASLNNVWRTQFRIGFLVTTSGYQTLFTKQTFDTSLNW